jgi:hypothetical protein
MSRFLDVYDEDAVVQDNSIRGEAADFSFPPSFAEARPRLPSPWITTNGARGAAAIGAYWKSMELLFRNLKRATQASGFKKPFADAAFNENFFMWDAAFMSMHWRYAASAFDFQQGLDNLYAKQHADGFICREIRESDGTDYFHRHDPAATGPNVLAWAELEYFSVAGDVERLRRVFPALLAYHRWLKRYRTWPDGSYWASGLASGMDNQPRVRRGESVWVAHAHTAWIDATCQAALSARSVVRIAELIGAGDRPEVAALRAEALKLAAYVRDRMWDDARGTYADRRLGDRDPHEAELSSTRTVGAYWALLVGGGAVPAARLARFLAPLDDITHFNRPTRVPSLAASDGEYHADGGYWLGSAWPPTTFMVLKGCTAVGAADIAADIGANFCARVADAFATTGTVWENMAPEGAARGGNPAKGEFVGWGGLGAVPVLLEYVFGLRPDAGARELRWDVRGLDGFGVTRYPFGKGLMRIECLPRSACSEPPRVSVRSTVDCRVFITWGGGVESVGGVAVDRGLRTAMQIFGAIIDVKRNMSEQEATDDAAGAAVSACAPLVPSADAARAIYARDREAADAHLNGMGWGVGGGTSAGGVASAGRGAIGGGGASGAHDEALAALVVMGFSEVSAKAALAAAGGSLEGAITRLTWE